MMKSNICDYSDSYILAVTVTIIITTAGADDNGERPDERN